MSISSFSITLIHNVDGAVIESVTAKAELFGRQRSQIIGKTLSEAGLLFVDGKGVRIDERNHPVNRIAMTGERITDMPLGLQWAGSSHTQWLLFAGSPLMDDNGNISRVISTWQLRDIHSQHPISQKTPLPLMDEWERTFEAMQDVITILSPELRVVRANRAAYTTFELEEGKLIGRYCYEVFHGKSEPCDRCPAWQPDLAKSLETGLVYNPQLDKTFEVTSAPVLDDDGALIYLVHSARDVTQRLKDEEERSILSAAVEQTGESVLIAAADGTLQYVNPAYCRITGYSREELLGKHFSSLNAAPEKAEFFQKVVAQLKRGENWQGILTSVKKDGSHFTEKATISPILQNNGEISHFVAVKRDVSLEEQLQRQLQQAMKMEAIGTLAGGIAHDFNNILSAMIGYGQIAKGRLAKDDPLFEDIDQILLAGDRAANLVKQILTFSRRDSQENFHPLKIQYIIKETTKLLRSSIPTTIELRQHIDNSCSPILAEPSQIHQVIMNLCTNARQAIGGNYGMLTISLGEIEVKEPQVIAGNTLLTTGAYAHLQVQDNGCGMSKDVRERIFDPFFTTKPKDQGTGLGLSVVHGIVEKHGGIITVESEENVGTSFDLYFPVVKQDVHRDTETVDSEAVGSERIMVVDDETVLARLIERILGRLGYKIYVYNNSLEAVRDYRQNPQGIDLVITDMTMPHMTGAELAREVLSLRPELPIIMTTGFSETIDEEKAARIGITEFMLKPIKKKPLVEMVRKVLDNAQNSSD